MSTYKPLGTQVIVRPDVVEETTPSGIILQSKKKAETGVIVALSDDYDFEVEVGQRVQFFNNHVEELEDGTWIINGHSDTGVIYMVFKNDEDELN